MALSQAQVANLYTAAIGPVTTCSTPYTSAAIQPDALFFEATFATDPRAIAGSDATYGWLSLDSSDVAADQAAHTGLILLNGSVALGSCCQYNESHQNGVYYGQFVDMAQASGPSSVTPLPILTHGGLGKGSQAAGTQGWSYEIVFKSYVSGLQTGYSMAFDFSNNNGTGGGAGSWDMLLGWDGNSGHYKVDAIMSNNQYNLSPVTPTPTPIDTCQLSHTPFTR